MNYRFLCSAVVLVGLASHARAGMIEICKDAGPAGSLSGVADFTIAGQAGTLVVPVGACSPRFSCRMDLPPSPNFLSPVAFC